jgi:kynurenine--oxoglutarate transaminase/cysteine-S-conjugate beta-lyase/glutamine--phenylpyruvate transaminase
MAVWHEFTPLAQTTGAVNLGQGFPVRFFKDPPAHFKDWSSPDFVKESLHRAVNANHNQYTRSGGHLRLVKAIGAHYSPLMGRELDPLTQITTTVGATEAIFACTQSLLNPGDEVVVFEPAFDIYR